MQDKQLRGAGPFTFDGSDFGGLAAGEQVTIRLESYEKGKYREYLPFDSLLVKNYDGTERIELGINGVYSVDVDPAGKDTYEDAEVRQFSVKNVGSNQIAKGDVTISVQREPFDADDATRRRVQQSPVRQLIENKLGVGI